MMSRVFGREWVLKLISLILAIGLWYYARGEEGIEIKKTIPLEIQVENEQMSLLKVSTNHIMVMLTTPRSQLSNIASEGIKAVHEIGRDVKTAGDYSFRIDPRDIKLPSPYIRVIKIEPELVHATLDELIVKKLEIKAFFLGDPAFGYKVREDEIQLNPNAILIEGSKAQLEELDDVKTKPVDLIGRIRSFRRTVEVDLPSNVKSLSESNIDVFIPIREEFDEKSFEDVSVRILKSPDKETKVTLDPPKISFVLKGSRRRLEKLEPGEIMAYLDTYDLKVGDHEMPVQLVLPEEVSLKDPSSVVVKVTIKKV